MFCVGTKLVPSVNAFTGQLLPAKLAELRKIVEAVIIPCLS